MTGAVVPPRESADEFGAEEEVPTLVDDEREQIFGRYKLLYQLAFGGMATIYLGRALGPAGFDRPVAIKRIHPHLAKQRSFVEMFLDEARIVSRINHPNVCSIYDFGEIDGVYYLAMEYLVGESLASVLKALAGRPDRLETRHWHAFALRLMADSCEGLHAAHELRDEQGRPLDVVHRDISPQNLFVTYDGAIKVVDFGIASARDRLHETSTGVLKGKLAYIAPEQLDGNKPDRRADVWALGVCAWEMLTATRLFRRSTEVQTIVAVRSSAIPPPSGINRSVDPAIDAIVLRALERDPAQRYESARAFGQAIGDYLAACGARTGLADLAELMRELFVRERTRKLELLEDVQQSEVRAQRSIHFQATEVDHVIAGKRTRDEVDRGASTSALPASTTMTAPKLTADDPPPMRTLPTPADAQARPTRERRFLASWIAVVVFATTAAIIGFIVVLSLLGDEPQDGRVAAAVQPQSVSVAGEAPARSTHSQAAQPELSAVNPTPTPADMPAPSQAAPLAPNAPAPRATTAPVPADTPEPRAIRTRGPQPTGTVNIVTPGGWADVYLGRRRLGRTPRQVTLPAGRRVLLLYPSGRPPAREVVVQVRPGETLRVPVPL